LAQADALIEAIEQHDPFDLHDAFLGAAAQGRQGWREPILRSLTELKREALAKEIGL
jgi:hypothetical protein